eukprot:CAMPEP_0170631408 /NCGR_PEP_ID=MMETSP0224-20130122/34621_1 /TAXON_ID=285029 /ORGANISM="Togula jolla, Strain CCCM 725" /LENGTH=293 /DNA_ID=CAMNT_0010959737 /DNA_START=45 /DNA_END=927 /DNA_ORIENTATION=+
MLSSRCGSPHGALPSTTPPPLDGRFYKTKICSFFAAGSCKRGARCTYAHSEEHIAALPDLRGTKPCRAFGTKHGCKKGDACAFAHLDADRRRQPVTPVSSMPMARRIPMTSTARLQPGEALKIFLAQREAVGPGPGFVGLGMLSRSRQTTCASTLDGVSPFSSSSPFSCPKSRVNSEEDLCKDSQDDVPEGCFSESDGNASSPRRKSLTEMSDDSTNEGGSMLRSFGGDYLEADFWSDGDSSRTATCQLFQARPRSRRAWADIADDSDDEGPWCALADEDQDDKVIVANVPAL